jgi:hypothetical protein
MPSTLNNIYSCRFLNHISKPNRKTVVARKPSNSILFDLLNVPEYVLVLVLLVPVTGTTGSSRSSACATGSTLVIAPPGRTRAYGNTVLVRTMDITVPEYGVQGVGT